MAQFDLFPTVTMTVPFLKELLARMRDVSSRRSITIIHADSTDQAQWILSNAAARLQRGGLRVAGPEPKPPALIVEEALRLGSKYLLAGEMRRIADAQALRAAAALGINVAATISRENRRQVEDLLALVGPWENYDVKLLSRQPPTRR
jgi:hypothetical protein